MLTLPSRIMNYRVSSASPTDELLSLGQILSEIGDYAGTILDREHLSLSRRCAARLGKVVSELITRKRIKSRDDLFDMPAPAIAKADLSAMTISELRQPLRRKPSDRNERLKIDYCVSTYSNELDNLSSILSLPVRSYKDKAYPDPSENHSPKELASLIRRHTGYRDIIGREILVEYVDYALDLLKSNPSQPMPELLAAEHPPERQNLHPHVMIRQYFLFIPQSLRRYITRP